MKVIMSMAISLDGFIATESGSEDFLSNSNWLIFNKFLNKYKHVIWGRKTFEAVKKWGDDYLNDLSKHKVIVVTKDKNYKPDFDFVIVANDISEALQICEKHNFPKAYISGGAYLNSEFLNKNLISEIYLSIQPIIIGKGIKLFNDTIQHTLLTLKKIDSFEEVIILHYNVLNEKI